MNHFKFNYKTTLPKELNTPSVSIYGDIESNYAISFNIQQSNGKLLNLNTVNCSTNQTVYSNINQWYNDWVIDIYENNKLLFREIFNPSNKVIFIKMDAHALGDNIAWIPYVEEFRKLRNCTVICSTFYNDLFKNVYPDILFVAPNTNIDNVYAQYYIGAVHDVDLKYSPVCVDEVPLQAVAYELLKLPKIELRPKLENQFGNIKHNKKYVCISEYASHENKHWKYENGWQIIVDYLNSMDYDVVVISKEATNLNNIIDLTGNKSILERAELLKSADFFIGLSSGLSWLSWAVNTHVFMISDITQVNHEFQSNITRISANPELNKINYSAPNITNPETVIQMIKKYLETKS
jgi:autotransporter strand-loop-strand O-heptosyltransferase